jgi:hypothetical protein
MGIFDKLFSKVAPGHDHGLDDYTVVDPDEFTEGDSSDVIVVDGVPDEEEDVT